MKKIPALILARGGSKGIPGKNLRQVGGASLVARSLIAAGNSKMSPVYLWSDSEEMRDIATRLGMSAPIRPDEFSGDTISTEDTVKAFLDMYDAGGKFDALAVIQCTTPFLRADHISAAFDKYMTGAYDSVVSVTDASRRFFGYPSHNGLSEFVPMRPYRVMRQRDSAPFWLENGGIYLASRELWNGGRRIGQRCGIVQMDPWESIEIDDPIDLEVAEAICKLVGG